MSEQADTNTDTHTNPPTDAQRFEEGVRTLFRVPKKAVMARIEAEKAERKKKREAKQT